MLRLELLASVAVLLCTYAQPPSQQPPLYIEHMEDTNSPSRSPHGQESPLLGSSGNDAHSRRAWVDVMLSGSNDRDSAHHHNDPSSRMQSAAASLQHQVGLADKPNTRYLPSATSTQQQQSSLQNYSLQHKTPVFRDNLVSDAKDYNDQNVNTLSSESKLQETMSGTNSVAVDASTARPDTTTAPVGDDSNEATLSSLLKEAFLSHNPSITAWQIESDNSETQADLTVPHTLSNSGRPAHPSLANNEPNFSDNRDRMTQEQVMNQDGNNQAPISVEQRSWRCPIPDVLVGEEDLPWTCRQHFAWRNLGEYVYPSRLYEAICEGRSCWYGHFNCTAITYTVHVLQVCLRGCQDQRVPYPLRSRWQWTDMNVTVGCQCVR